MMVAFPSVNSAHPLARGLVFLGVQAGDAVTRTGPWEVRASARLAPTPFGPGFESTGTPGAGGGGGLACPWRAELLAGSTQSTVAIWASMTTWGGFSGLVVTTLTDENWDAGPRVTLYTTATSTMAYHSSTSSSGGEAYASSGAAYYVIDGSWHHYAAVRTGATVTFYRDGALHSTGVATNGTPVVGVGSGTGHKVHLLALPSKGFSGAAKAAVPSIWTRALGPSEVAWLAVDPFCMIRRK